MKLGLLFLPLATSALVACSSTASAPLPSRLDEAPNPESPRVVIGSIDAGAEKTIGCDASHYCAIAFDAKEGDRILAVADVKRGEGHAWIVDPSFRTVTWNDDPATSDWTHHERELLAQANIPLRGMVHVARTTGVYYVVVRGADRRAEFYVSIAPPPPPPVPPPPPGL
jgi:hypothetical protein